MNKHFQYITYHLQNQKKGIFVSFICESIIKYFYHVFYYFRKFENKQKIDKLLYEQEQISIQMVNITNNLEETTEPIIKRKKIYLVNFWLSVFYFLS